MASICSISQCVKLASSKKDEGSMTTESFLQSVFHDSHDDRQLVQVPCEDVPTLVASLLQEA